MATKKKVVRPDVECPVCKRWVKGVLHEMYHGTRNGRMHLVKKYRPWKHNAPSGFPCLGDDCVAKRMVQM